MAQGWNHSQERIWCNSKRVPRFSCFTGKFWDQEFIKIGDYIIARVNEYQVSLWTEYAAGSFHLPDYNEVCTIKKRYEDRPLIESLRSLQPWSLSRIRTECLTSLLRYQRACQWIIGFQRQCFRNWKGQGDAMSTANIWWTLDTLNRLNARMHRIVRNPLSDKGTHLSAIESMIIFSPSPMFAKTSTHKLTNSKEHLASSKKLHF